MDMKKILQAFDGASTNPVEGSNDMKKFLRAVTESDVSQPTGAPAASAEPAGPEYEEYCQKMAMYDMMSKEVAPEPGIEKGASPDALAAVQQWKTAAEKIAGPNLQAWEQARQTTTAANMAQAQANQPALAAQLENVGMSRLLSIISESKGPLNRQTTAETMAMQHYAESEKKTITTPVLNVQEGATPSMIGKYFKTVEQELKEAAERPNERATKLARRVIERIVPNADGSLPDPNINRLTGKPNAPAAEPEPTPAPAAPAGPRGANLKMTVLQQLKAGTYKGFAPKLSPEEIDAAIEYKQSIGDLNEAEGEPEGVAHLTKELLTHIVQQSGKEGAHAIVKSLTWGDGAAKELLHLIIDDLKDDIKGMDETVKQRLDPKCWKGKHKEGTKIKGGVRVNNCVPNEGVAEAGVVDTIKTKAKQFGKYMTEPQSPHNNFVRDRAKNIDKIRKQKEKEQGVAESGSPAQQAAIAIAKKKAGKK